MLKKILIILGIILTTTTANAVDCYDFECKAPYDMNTKFKTIVGATFGVNRASEFALQKVIKKAILKKAKVDNLVVDIESSSSRDLKNGIFKFAQIEGDNLALNGIYLSHFMIKTLCDFNYVKYDNSEILIKEDLPMEFEVKISANDLNQTMNHEKYQKLIRDLNKLTKGLGLGIRISSTKVSIRGNQFYYTLYFEVPFVRDNPKLVFQSDLKVKRGKIDLSNTRLRTDALKLSLKQTKLLVNYLNPLDFSVNIFKDKDVKVNVMNATIKDNIIYINGYLVAPKD